MKKTTRTLMIVALLFATVLCTPSCGSTASVENDSSSNGEINSSLSNENNSSLSDENESSLNFDKYYIIMPELSIRADPDTPGAIDTVYAGQEVDFLYSSGDYSMFNYQKDGKTLSGSTWTGAIAPAVKIHLLEDAFIFHRPGMDRTDLGSISTWREPTDPDILILWEETVEGEKWYYVLSVEDCRAGYMKGDIPYEIVE